MARPTSQDSNATGLRFAEETAVIGVLPAQPVWYEGEPNSYKDFGGQLTTMARKPITNTRQRRKGTVTDLDASGGWNQDWTLNNLTRLLQGFFFANVREKRSTAPLNGATVAITGVTSADKKYNTSGNPGAFAAGRLVLASGFGVAANNGIKHVASSDVDDITIVEATANEAAPPADAKVQIVGVEGASGDITLNVAGTNVQLRSTVLDFTTLGVLPGEWIFVGGDAVGNRFDDQYGVARIGVGGVAAHAITLDKISWSTPVTATGAAKTIQIFLGSLLRNEPAFADIKRRTFHLERALGSDEDGVMAEYLIGAACEEFTVNVPTADKINCDLSFTAIDHEIHSGADGMLDGTRVASLSEEAINTSSDIARINLSIVSDDPAPEPLFAYASDMNLTIKNNISPNKAIGKLGSFNVSTGTFEVDGKMTVYFADAPSVQAVRNNADVTLDMFVSKANSGFVVDVPLLSLGDGRLSVEQDKPISLPLDTNASESAFGYTAAMVFFPYLPTIAM